MVGTWTSCRHTGSAEHVQDGPVGHAEVLADHGERLTGLVHLLGDCDIVVAEDAIARLHADPSQKLKTVARWTPNSFASALAGSPASSDPAALNRCESVNRVCRWRTDGTGRWDGRSRP